MEQWFSRNEFLTGIIILLGILGTIMAKLGFIRFQINNRTRNASECPDPDCKKNIIGNIEELKTIFRTEVFPKINKTAEDVKYIKGWIDGKKE